MAADVALKHATPKHKVADFRRCSPFPSNAMQDGNSDEHAAPKHKSHREVVLEAVASIGGGGLIFDPEVAAARNAVIAAAAAAAAAIPQTPAPTDCASMWFGCGSRS